MNLTAVIFSNPYVNPIMERTMPDPTVIEDGYGNYYMYATNTAKKVPIYTSTDLINWTYTGDSFSPDQMPTGIEGGGVWAPDVIKYKNKYLMAYAYSKPGELHNNGIGLAISDNPYGPFKNLGLLFTSKNVGVINSIDPAFIEEKGKLYLIWGSFHGIYITELKQNATGSFAINNDDKIQIAGNAFEGAHVFKRGKYYYLFASTGSCCSKDNSTYRVVVGRSKNLFGPYVDEKGVKMMDDGYNLVVASNNKFAGPGHGSSIITDKKGKTWYIYHSFIRGHGEKGRLPMLDELLWTSTGWPYIYKCGPSDNSSDSPIL